MERPLPVKFCDPEEFFCGAAGCLWIALDKEEKSNVSFDTDHVLSWGGRVVPVPGPALGRYTATLRVYGHV